MIDKDIKYKDVPQLVKPRKDGKRPGYRGDAAGHGTGDKGDGPAGGGGAPGPGDTGGPGGFGPSTNQFGAKGSSPSSTGGGPGRDTGLERARQKAIQAAAKAKARRDRIAAVETVINRNPFGFTDAANINLLSPKSIGTGLLGLVAGPLAPAALTSLKNMGPFNNQDFYDQKVAPAGITDLSYDDYMDARLSGQIDAYGNPIGNTGGGDGGSASSQAQLIQQAAIANPIANPTVETPQGGVGELYAQYMRNLGYTL